LVRPISAPVNALDALMQKTPVIEETVIEDREETRDAEQNAFVSRTEQEVTTAENDQQMQEHMNESVAEVQLVQEGVVQNEAKTADFRSSFVNAWNWLKENLLLLWGAGALIVFCWFVIGYARFIKQVNEYSSLPTKEDEAVFRSLAGKSRVTMLYNSAISTPLLIGVIHPRILVPEREYVRNGKQRQLQNLLRHELVHYRRKDILYKWASVIVSSLHWFNPLMPLIRKEIAAECEFSCDETVIRRMTDEEKMIYGETLLSFAVRRELPKGIAAVTLGERKTNLKIRLKNIIAYHKKPLWVMAISFILAIALAGCAVVTGVTSGKKQSYKAPEALVEAYINSINEDISLQEMMEFYATEEVRKNINKKAFEEMYKYPAEDWFRGSEEINVVSVASAASTISLALYPKTLEEQQQEYDEYFAGVVYSEMTRKELIDFLSVPYEKNLSEIDKPIVIERIDDVDDSIDEENLAAHEKAIERRKKTYGADDVRQLTALISCGGKKFVRGFHLMKYDGSWKIFGHGVGLNVSDKLVEMTEEEYFELIGEETESQTVVQSEEQKALAERIAEELAEEAEQETLPSELTAETEQEMLPTEPTAETEQHSEQLSENVKYPRLYFDDYNFETKVGTYIELTMSYDEVFSILSTAQEKGWGEITRTGKNDAVSRDPVPQGKWIHFEQHIQTDNGVEYNGIGFYFDENDRLFEMGGAWSESDREYVLSWHLPTLIFGSERQVPLYYGNDERDIFMFPRAKTGNKAGYSIRILEKDPQTGEHRRFGWALSMIDYREKYAEENEKNVFLIFPNEFLNEWGDFYHNYFPPEGAISAEDAIKIASEKRDISAQDYEHHGYAIYNGEYYHALRKGDFVKDGGEPAYSYVSMDGQVILEGSDRYIP